MMQESLLLDQEVNDDLAGFALHVGDLYTFAEVLANLREQGKGIVIIAKTHRFAGIQRIERAEDGGMTEPARPRHERSPHR